VPIPNNQKFIAEILVPARQAAAGSNDAPAINVFHFRRTTISNAWNSAAIGARFVATVGAALLAATNVRYAPGSVRVRCVNDALDPYEDVTFAGTGAIATDSIPSDDAVCVILKSATRGKSYQGRKHFSPLSEIDTTGDVLTGAGLTRWQAVRDACLAGFTIAGTGEVWVPCVLSRKLSQLRTNPTNVVTADIVRTLLDLNVGTMRRRRTRTVR
jgi:hypothetical protein